MSSKSHVKLTIALINPDLDEEEQERETRNLLREIRDLDVESAELVEATEIPERGKPFGGFLLGVLQAEVSIANFKKLLGFLCVDALSGLSSDIAWVTKPSNWKLRLTVKNSKSKLVVSKS
ncbi:hypothetical protein [Dendronalium sp. ChiSLP03b]|uniref:hypothetical protein n=1 Tax=Dendronalium sp. ChiSLP03b TaxID=3075381 RepID=UPI002AD5AB18|nr:hypothetical protein [Dendronalium sp. ChiSLP03b]MDZ8209064.1 hypothetical protein [Dendronalium sp. ChiSLP03b]